MVYILKSNSYRLQKDKIKEITNNIDNIIYYDLENSSIKDIIEECNYNDLFNSKKVVVVYNSYIFNTQFEYKDELKILSDYLSNENSNTYLIFLTDNYSTTKSIVKKIKSNGCLLDIKNPIKDELNDLIRKYLSNNGYKIENGALNLLISYENNIYDYILNELDKIMIIKKDYFINIDDIKKYSTIIENDDIFVFLDHIMNKDIKKVFKYYDVFIKNKEEPAILLSNIAKQYRLIYSVKNLIKEYNNEEELAKYLGIHPYRVKLAKKQIYSYSNEELKSILLRIGKLDEDIKLSKIDKYQGLRSFLIEIM